MVIYLYRYARVIALVEIFFRSFFFVTFFARAIFWLPPICVGKSDGVGRHGLHHHLVHLHRLVLSVLSHSQHLLPPGTVVVVKRLMCVRSVTRTLVFDCVMSHWFSTNILSTPFVYKSLVTKPLVFSRLYEHAIMIHEECELRVLQTIKCCLVFRTKYF